MPTPRSAEPATCQVGYAAKAWSTAATRSRWPTVYLGMTSDHRVSLVRPGARRAWSTFATWAVTAARISASGA